MHEIMTIEDVAKYLRVSERTVYDWAQKGILPGGKIGTTWRFKSADIQKWVNDKLNNDSIENKEINSEFYSPLSSKRVIIKNKYTKNNALNDLIDLISASPQVIDKNLLRPGIIEREKIMSTGIGFGIAIPHVRSDAVTNLVMAVGVFKDGINDYESLDNKSVNIICLIAAKENQHKEYLNMLSMISARLKESFVRKEILNSNDKKVICDLLINN